MKQPDIIDRLDNEECYVDAIDDAIAEIRRLRKEVKLLRKIADETKRIWDAGQFRLEWATLKNLLADRIDFDDRNAPTA